jgi:LmbE family N-acetylglucosaminyl deacetylase
MGEVKKAGGILGVPESNIIYLEFEDGSLGEHEKEAGERIREILTDHNPSEVYFPCAKDFHPDHRAANRIVTSSLQRMTTNVSEYQYSIMQTSRIGPALDRLLNPIRKTMVNIDISQFLDLKRKAVNEFKSEVSIVAKGQVKPLMRNVDKYLSSSESFYIRT